MYESRCHSGTNISRTLVFVTVLFSLVLILSGCSDSSSGPGTHASLGDCKETYGLVLDGQASPDEDCVFYSFSDGTLTINHVNAGFNCCTGAHVEVDIDAKVITITEVEDLIDLGCHCLCLYDFDYVVTGLTAAQYTIKIIEPYCHQDDDPLEFTVDFASTSSGSYCVDRDYYPWGYSNSGAGELTAHSECMGYDEAYAKPAEPDTLGCIIYEYDDANTLQIRHTNAVLNCCPVFAADITIHNNVITITEIDSVDAVNGGCDCICPFDLDYEITDLWPGVYTIKIIEPYMNPEEDSLITTIDLWTEPSGEFCVARKHLPLM
jgi:hypothetical protein